MTLIRACVKCFSTGALLLTILFADGYNPISSYFFASVNPKDSTIHIRLDGAFFYQQINSFLGKVSYPDKIGSLLNSPATAFEHEYMQNHFRDCRECLKVDLLETTDEGLYKIECDPWLMTKSIGMTVGDNFEIIKPDMNGEGGRITASISAFYYYSPDHMYSHAYLLAKTEKIDDISIFGKESLIAVYRGRSSGEDMRLLKSLKTQRDQYTQMLRNASRTPTTDPDSVFAKIDSFSSEVDFKEVTTLEFYVHPGEFRYLVCGYKGTKNIYSRTLIMDTVGNEYPSPIFTSGLSIVKPLGIIHVVRPGGRKREIEDLVVCEMSYGPYARGVSLFKSDMNGVLRQIVSLLLYSD